MHGFTI